MKKILVVMVSLFMLSASALNAGQISTSDSTMLFGQSHVHNVALLDKSEMVATQGEGWGGAIFGAIVGAVAGQVIHTYVENKEGLYLNVVTTAKGGVAGFKYLPF